MVAAKSKQLTGGYGQKRTPQNAEWHTHTSDSHRDLDIQPAKGLNSHAYFLSIDQGCQRLNLGKTSIYKLVSLGRLKLYHVLGRSLLCSTDLDDLIAELLTRGSLCPPSEYFKQEVDCLPPDGEDVEVSSTGQRKARSLVATKVGSVSPRRGNDD